MNEHIVSCCPKCSEQFSISPEQLAVADGRVRCGNCMTIFNGPANQVDRNSSTGAIETASADAVTNDWFSALLPPEQDQDKRSQAPLKTGTPYSEEGRIEPTLNLQRHELLNSIERDSIKLTPPRSRSSIIAIAGWTIASIALLLTLAIQWQLTVPAHQSTASIPELPIPQVLRHAICTYLHCVRTSSMADFLIENVRLHDHPENKSAVQLSARLINSSLEEQATPPLSLTFTDLSGKVVGFRIFSPGEYLFGELQGRGTIPARTPVHIAFDLADPGPAAINYQLAIYSE